ncbi:Abi-alpha family protein [Nocardioides terrisoli]|uniref:Abi-alpha family protein n=1 Tax=Nocardioides terrisoli TaxID=3388267 RepID=UPI00287B7CB4|nr:Abi-alpha family protein [Nocardioides marmorisolisilvae]
MTAAETPDLTNRSAVPDTGRVDDDAGNRLPARWDGAAEALPGIARIAGTAWARSAAWTLGSSVRSGKLLAKAMTNPAAAGELVQEVARDLAVATRTVSDVARAVSDGVPLPRAVLDGTLTFSAAVLPEAEVRHVRREPSLRERGEELLQRSRDVWSDEEPHPAYARIIDELAPDEGRILLLLLRGGPQPSVDVRTGGPVGMVSSSLVAGGMNMIGPRAGVRYLDEVPSYLNNLFRLGLVWFSREQLEDPLEYQVVEAQPDVLEAMHSTRFTKVVRRSIHLTPFGLNFCKTCLVDREETTDLPTHQVPDES